VDAELEDVIAIRELTQGDRSVLVRIGRPQMAADMRSARCTWEIDGLESGPIRLHTDGVDTVQALSLALGMIGDTLAHRARVGSVIEFDGATELGFPTNLRPT
jgi:hypothetical protein